MSGNDIDLFGPTSFQDYLKSQGLQQKNTATQISIDSYEKLPSILKENDTMVLRLGSSPRGVGTQFLLVKVRGRLRDFFLFDSEIFKESRGEYFEPVNLERLIGFRVLPTLSETSLVNLAISSGLIGKALGLDNDVIPSVPATGQSTFSFLVKPHSAIDKIIQHRNGQVEIDALFVEKRSRKETLFIIEAKSDDIHKSLSKHKLVYPVLAVAKNVPRDIPIVPVYMKIKNTEDGLHFHIVECEYPDPRISLTSIDELTFKSHKQYFLRLNTNLGVDVT